MNPQNAALPRREAPPRRPARRRRAAPTNNRMSVREVLIGALACLGLFLSGVLVGRNSDPFRFDAPDTEVVDANLAPVAEPEGDR